MSLLKEILLLAHVFSLFEKYGCAQTFNKVGDKSMLFVDKKLPFADAERYCAEKNSKLVEFWTADEWKEVRVNIRNWFPFSSWTT